MEWVIPRATCDTSVYFALERVPEPLLMSPKYINPYKFLKILDLIHQEKPSFNPDNRKIAY